VAVSYEGLPWITGAAVMLAGATPDHRIFVLAALYSLGAHGIMTLNDFKSVEGDRQMKLGSLPVRLGPERAARLACVVMALPQFAVVGLLFAGWGQVHHAVIVSVMLLAQLALMARLLTDPRRLAPWYNATGVSLYVLGMLVSAFALRHGLPAPA
jgi:chlorophyll synthase